MRNAYHILPILAIIPVAWCSRFARVRILIASGCLPDTRLVLLNQVLDPGLDSPGGCEQHVFSFNFVFSHPVRDQAKRQPVMDAGNSLDDIGDRDGGGKILITMHTLFLHVFWTYPGVCDGRVQALI